MTNLRVWALIIITHKLTAAFFLGYKLFETR